ncbi:MAG: pantoate--beta-alanine ligase [SAR86 cluster bacterium]|uniref:Pantothenate synthetase n=1 Tax=SAR86 cluster bacterium TaxID=2030880 RepID=A0A2A4XAK5_9GAMM|nr:MAG: pantoate--beta-alanine ligase [SAR86 cluster bacterium]
MQTQKKIKDLRQILKTARSQGKSIALVPTMGNLHEGHLQLIRQARDRYDFIVCSIFVNPLQFSENEDLAAYPRTLEADRESLRSENCDCLFLPSINEIYGDGLEQQTSINVPGLTENLCGSSRPGHFVGVATVVTTLFNIVQPDAAFFGLKDYQQFLVIRKLTQDLALEIAIHGIETHREESGLAMSSRNNYLSEQQRQQASSLYRCLQTCAEQIQQGNTEFNQLEKAAKKELKQASLKPDYFQICDADTLQPPSTDTQHIAILGAIFVGKSRLIDNIRFQRS